MLNNVFGECNLVILILSLQIVINEIINNEIQKTHFHLH